MHARPPFCVLASVYSYLVRFHLCCARAVDEKSVFFPFFSWLFSFVGYMNIYIPGMLYFEVYKYIPGIYIYLLVSLFFFVRYTLLLILFCC